MCKDLRSLLSTCDDCKELATLCTTRFVQQHKLIHFWTHRIGAGHMLGFYDFPNELYGIVIACITQHHEKMLVSMAENDTMIYSCVQKLKEKFIADRNANKSCFKTFKKCGLWNRSIADSRVIVWSMLVKAITDIVVLVGMLLLFLTGVKALPLIRDLWNLRQKNKTLHDSSHTGAKVILVSIFTLFMFVCTNYYYYY